MIVKFSLVLLCFALIGVTSAQEELTTFEEIRDFIDNEVGVISTVIHFRHCHSDDINVTETHMHVIEEFDQWLYFDYGNGTEKYRTTKYSLNDEGQWVFLIIEAFSNNNNTQVLLQTLSPLDFSELGRITLNCPTGEAAHYFAYGKDRPSATLNEYEDLKTALLEGKHVFTKSEVSSCQGGDSLGFARLINGKSPLDFWEIHNNGLDGETIWLSYDVWVDYPYYLSTSLVGVEKILISVTPDGTVTYLPIILDMITWEDGFDTPGIGFKCDLGTSFRVYTPETANTLATYENYQQLVEGLKGDHQPEVVIDSTFCLIDGAPAEFPVVSSRKPSMWVLDSSSEESFGVLMTVSYVASGTDGYGIAVQEQATFQEVDNTVTVDINVIDPRTGAILQRAQAVCTPGEGALVRSVSRPRNVLGTLDDLHAAVFEGRQLSWQADLADCSGLDDYQGTITLGGTYIHGTTFDPHASNGTFYAPMTALFQADENADTFEWISLSTYWFGSAETVLHLFLSQYNYAWEDDLVGQGDWVCPVPSESAYIYY